MIRFFTTPWIVKARYPELIWRFDSEDTIYLTFDDGPNPEATPWVLSQLNKFNAKATFFCLGKNLMKNKGLAEKILEEGHLLANHTQNHLNGWKSMNRDYQDDILNCDRELMNLGVHNQLFRPPYGRIRKSQISAIKNRRIVMWSHLSWDFDPQLDVKKSISRLKGAKAGSILVFHDSGKAFDNLKVILPEILSFFSSKGMKFESIR